MAERLQKIIAESGLMSRRAAENAINAGRVTLNGCIARLGDRAEADDNILLDGKPIPLKEQKRYYMLNKPRGYVCTMDDEQGRRTVRELLPDDAGRVYPVGRLDLMSEGLLLMTNDGDFALRVTHPSGMLMKTYRVRVEGENLAEQINRLQKPFCLDDTVVQALNLSVLKNEGTTAVLDITIGEGKNREIRRMCDEAGLRVRRLTRIAEGPLTLGKLPTGRFRQLTEKEIAAVMGEADR